MSERSDEKVGLVTPPWCKGSMIVPKRTTVVSRAHWGLCPTCNRFVPMSTQGKVKMHRDQAIPPEASS